MAPRGTSNAPTKPAASAGRGKPAKAAVPAVRAPVEVAAHRPAPNRKEVCPLCIEELDATDLSFVPCPCGYRICLFCYEQVKIQCQSKCPGCRREYGTVTEAGDGRDDAFDEYTPQDSTATVSNAAASTSGSRPAARATAGVLEASAGARAAAAAAAAASRSQSQATANTQQDAAAAQPSARRGSPVDAAASARGGTADEAAPVGLPSSSNWASLGSAARTDHPALPSATSATSLPPLAPTSSSAAGAPSAPLAPAAMDQSAWPSLADSSAAQASRQRSDADSSSTASAMRRSASAASNSAERFGSSSSLDQIGDVASLPPADHHQQQQQQQHGHRNHQHQQQQQSQLPNAASPSRKSGTAETPNSNSKADTSGTVAVPPSSTQHQHPSTPSTPEPYPPAALQAAQVSTTVQGMRRSVTVPLAGGTEAEVYPEAPALVERMQQAVISGAMHTRDAAAQLLTLLRHKEATKAQALLAAGKAPPGFTSPQFGVAAAAPPRSFLFSSCLNNQDNPVVAGPPVGRYNPISPPPYANGGSSSSLLAQAEHVGSARLAGSALGLANGSSSNHALGVGGSSSSTWQSTGSLQLDGLGSGRLGGFDAAPSSASASGLGVAGGDGGAYSLWSVSGLPGIDYGGSSLWQTAAAPFPAAAATAAPAAGLVGVSGYAPSMSFAPGFGGSAVSAYDPQFTFPSATSSSNNNAASASSSGVKMPPPGFGGEQFAGGVAPRPMYSPLQQPIGTRYNPLGAIAGTAAAPGQPPPAYRPQLGNGL